MVAFDQLRLTDGTPIYQQLIAFVKRGLVAGTIQDGEELPSRRVVSALLGVNPNTIQKTFRLLEEEGLIDSHPGAKSIITATPARIATLRAQLLEADMGQLVDALKATGLNQDEATALFLQLWQSKGESL